VGTAALVWFVNILSMILIPLLALVPYFIVLLSRDPRLDLQRAGQTLGTDPTALLITLAATVPAHALTLFVVWAVVTRLGKRPFWRTIGWSWDGRFGFWWSVVTAVVLLVVGISLTYYFGGEKTPFDQMLESSAAARFTTAALATVSAPLIEELVFRGVIYPAVSRALSRLIVLLKTLTSSAEAAPAEATAAAGRSLGWLIIMLILRAGRAVLTLFGRLDARRGGMVWAVGLVSLLFLSVHVPQYQNNLAVIAAVGLLSVALTSVRALTGRVLPCFIIHLVFNGVQVAGLVYEYFRPAKPAALLGVVARLTAPGLLHF
jgi:membrane protease YdiL (CAAX protease family)